MLAEQRSAEKQKDASEKYSEKLIVKQAEAEKKKIQVNEDLGNAEPALIEAQKSLAGVTSGQLSEIRVMQRPPDKVRVALEPVIILVSKNPVKPEWAEIRKFLG
jgi:dynein heavy chain 1